jgi:hypothetical protein
MAVDKPVEDYARMGAGRNTLGLKRRWGGTTAFTNRNKKDGEFMAVKKPVTGKKAAKKFKGVRREK